MNFLEIMLIALSDDINKIFLIIISLIVFIGIFFNIREKFENLRRFLPTFSVSIGIFGTFLGIFIGLSNFDTNNISGSIPALLDGMRLAFFTSLVGLLGSFILQIFYNTSDDKRAKGSADPMKSLQNIEASSVAVEKCIKELELAITSCFKSDEEYSLVSQVKLIRQELIDGRRETKQAFQEFAEHFSQMASESLVKQLQSVVDKFNVMLNDLVAQSFMELKESTERLNAWQADYKATIIKTNQNLESNFLQLTEHKILLESTLDNARQLVNQISTTRTHLEAIDTSLTQISVSGDELATHSKLLAEQNILLSTSLQEIKSVGDEAKKVIPEINSRVTEIINSINDASKTVSNNSEQLSRSIEENITKMKDASNNQIDALEKSLENELEKSLNSLVGALASLSEKFVSDYTPLTERLREIVRISEKVNHD